MSDDASCGVVYFRQPRQFMLITGSPFYKIKDTEFVKKIQEFPGKKIICGGTTAEIIARELGDSPPEEVVKLLTQHDDIHIIVGTRINWAHQDPDQPVELEIRKSVVRRIVRLLETRFFKKVTVELV